MGEQRDYPEHLYALFTKKIRMIAWDIWKARKLPRAILDDLIQEGWVGLLRACPRVDASMAPKQQYAYLATCAYYAMINSLRAWSLGSRTQGYPPHVAWTPSLDTRAIPPEEPDVLLAQSVQQLPQQEREVLLGLYGPQEGTLKAIGQGFGVSESRACQLHRQALRRLHQGGQHA